MGAITGDYLGAELWGSIPPIPTKNQTVVGWSPGVDPRGLQLGRGRRG